MKLLFSAWTLLLLPLAAPGNEPVSDSTAKHAAQVPMRTSVPDTPAGLHLKAESVQAILRAATPTTEAQPAPTDEIAAANARLKLIDFSAARQTTVRLENDDPLRRMYREQMRDQTIVTNADSYDAWLSCQDTNDLLSTFERFDSCNSVKLQLRLDRMSDKDMELPPLPR